MSSRRLGGDGPWSLPGEQAPGCLGCWAPWRWEDVHRLLTDGLRTEGLRGGDLFPSSPGSGTGWAGACRPSPEPSEPVGRSPDVNPLSVLWVLRARCLFLSLHFLNVTGEKTTATSWGRAAGTERKGSGNKRSRWSSCECSVNESCSLTRTHMHRHTGTRTHIHTCAHARTQAHMCVHRPMHVRTHPHTCAHTDMHPPTHARAQTCTLAHTCPHTCVHTHVAQGIPSKKTGTRGGPSPSGTRPCPPSVASLLREPVLPSGTQIPGVTCPEGAPDPASCGRASRKPPPEQAARAPRLPRLTEVVLAAGGQ